MQPPAMDNEMHVIFGTGPVGCWTAAALVAQGRPVRAVNRTGRRPQLLPEQVEMRSADVTDHDAAIAAAQGATTVYQALNPEYWRWHELFPGLQAGALAAARALGSTYVSVENLYMYDSSAVITEDSPIAPASRKGELRMRMAEEVMAAHDRGDVRAVALRSSDYYGPGVTGSALGEMVFGNLVAGRKAQLLGSARQEHSFAYIQDVGRAAAVLGMREDLHGSAWFAPHAPAVTQGELMQAAGEVLGGQSKASVISPLMMRLAGLFSPVARASMEMMYQFTAPFVVDAGVSQRELRLEPTPIRDGVAATITWYRDQASQ